MGNKRIIILGAGLAGLSAAWHLQKRGIDCQIFEKESEVGGLCRSKTIDGFTFDYDGHLLHFKHKYTFRLIRELLGNNLVEHKRSAWVYSFGRYIRYPFQANLYGLPSSVTKECLIGFIQALQNGRYQKKINPTFYDWITHAFGKGIAKHFMVPYNTKFWTLPPKELTCGWLDGFIPVPSLSQIIEGTIEESQRQFGYNARFWYPRKGGINQLPLALAGQIKNIYTDCQVIGINLNKKEIVMASGNKEKFNYLVSTIPLPELPCMIKELPPGVKSAFIKLRWNSIFNLNLGIDSKGCDGQHWIYFPQKEPCFFRVGFYHNFSSCLTPPDKQSLYAEVSYSQDKPIERNSIVLHIKEDLARVGLLVSGDKVYVQDINDIKYGYPIYDTNYQEARETILSYLLKNNIIPCGRYGSWRYMSMEDIILESKIITDKLA